MKRSNSSRMGRRKCRKRAVRVLGEDIPAYLRAFRLRSIRRGTFRGSEPCELPVLSRSFDRNRRPGIENYRANNTNVCEPDLLEKRIVSRFPDCRFPYRKSLFEAAGKNDE